MKREYDIIVIGAGHSGCEAAVASARLGSSVLLITMDMSKIAQMSCNPSIGGIAKGQIVREIDALGGFTGIVTDASTIQFRMLNKSKGPAMWSPRAQCDRNHFSMNWRHILETTCNLDIWQDIVTSLTLSDSFISGVSTSTGAEFYSRAVILTSGTFLNGKIFIGPQVLQGGRIGEPSSYKISDQLLRAGIKTERMKTGTPPRIDIRSIDLSLLSRQTGDPSPSKFSYLNYLSPIQKGFVQKDCWIAHTNLEVHDILKSAFHLSPLFSGAISGIGPRYCPSIEDKLRTFPTKSEHQLFLEPEGWHTNEYYLQGFSSSLPLETQLSALSKVKGFEKVQIYRPAYAVEYDFFDPTQLNYSLESKVISGLFLAGQVNGTTGYEEAAAQGLIAGVNAHRSINNLPPLILTRDSSYIGVLIDDLINKGVDEPYRMFTSRAEYRILLRQDNADLRLTPLAHSIGLVDDNRFNLLNFKYSKIDLLKSTLATSKVTPSMINQFLQSKGTSQISTTATLSSLLSRPQLSINDILSFVPRETLGDLSINRDDIINTLPYLPNSSIANFLHNESLNEDSLFFNEITTLTEILIKYSGYIEREKRIADKLKHLENIIIPANFDYLKVKSLSIEARQKLTKHKPLNIAQASRIPGVSPSDISVLLVYFGR